MTMLQAVIAVMANICSCNYVFIMSSSRWKPLLGCSPASGRLSWSETLARGAGQAFHRAAGSSHHSQGTHMNEFLASEPIAKSSLDN